MRRIELAGLRFGRLAVIRRAQSTTPFVVKWTCRCDCGVERAISTASLVRKKTQSCGCKSSGPRTNLLGRTFGRWTVISDGTTRRAGNTYWLCRCACGTERRLTTSVILKGTNSLSCGCYAVELRSRFHVGFSDRPEYRVWSKMKARCLTPSNSAYINYGARGIRIHEAWLHSFETFFAHVGPRPTPQHTIERIDNNGHYEPGNVRWATRKEQQNNRRANRCVVVDGERVTFTQLAERHAVRATSLSYHLKRGRRPEAAIAYLKARQNGQRQQFRTLVGVA